MIALIAEKPSVAKDIAQILGATQRCDGYLSGNGYLVTWAFGHLVQLAMPEAYGVANFQRESLPIIPAQFQLIPRQIKVGKEQKADPGVLKQLKIIKEVFGQCEKIIVATDAGREGELIFRFIYSYLKCNKPFVRLWISSLTDKAIREGLEKLQPGNQYDNLYCAAKARSEADWLIGINATQAMSIAAGQGVFSLGRVQTPTLMMICNRFLENKHFTPTAFWQIKLTAQKNGIIFSAQSVNKYLKQEEALASLQRVNSDGRLTVVSVEKRDSIQEPPLLYDLTTLQKEANTKLSFTAEKTLSIAQSLYENKVMSYPRTGSRFISEDVFEEIPARIALLGQYPRFAAQSERLSGSLISHRSVNDAKVTDHHALIITENLPGELSPDQRAIYEMVAGRMLEAFSDKCVKFVTSVVMKAGEVEFSVKGSVMKSLGWREVLSDVDKAEDDENKNMPDLIEGENLHLSDVEMLEKHTKPKPLHTESSLLAAMENAGQELEDVEVKASMKDAGIGTPATRAATIETLFTRQYIIREKKNLVPTEKGLAVYQNVKDKKIADVEMTGMWENALSKIEEGEIKAAEFRKDIDVYAAQITSELLSLQISVKSENDCPCPKCLSGHMMFYQKVVKCSNSDCSFVVFRNKCDKQLTDKQISDLLVKGKTSVIKGFKSKARKTFDAALSIDAQFNVNFVFSEAKSNVKTSDFSNWGKRGQPKITFS